VTVTTISQTKFIGLKSFCIVAYAYMSCVMAS